MVLIAEPVWLQGRGSSVGEGGVLDEVDALTSPWSSLHNRCGNPDTGSSLGRQRCVKGRRKP